MTGAAPHGIRLDLDGPVATISLSRPEVFNAQTPAMWERLRQIGRELTGQVRVAVIRGDGPAFSSGLDLTVAESMVAELARLPADDAADRIALFQQAFSWLRRPDLISIAAVRGHAIGAGFQLALACDLRILAQDAQFLMAEVSLGLVPDLTGTKRLVELVGYAHALELCVTGRRLSATEAGRVGLANLVVPGAEVDRAVADLVAAILAADRDAVAEVKALLLGAAGRDAAAQALAEREAQVRRIRSLAGLDD